MYLWREVPARLQGQPATGDNSGRLLSGSQLVSGASGEVAGNRLPLGYKTWLWELCQTCLFGQLFWGQATKYLCNRGLREYFSTLSGPEGNPGSAWKPDLGMRVGHLQGDEGRLGSRGHFEGNILGLSAFIGSWSTLMTRWNPKTKKNEFTYIHGILYIISKSQNPLTFLSGQEILTFKISHLDLEGGQMSNCIWREWSVIEHRGFGDWRKPLQQ